MTTTYIKDGIIHPTHPAFGKLPVVHDKDRLKKNDVAIHRQQIGDVVVDEVVGPATHLREIVATVSHKDKLAFFVVRDEVYTTMFILRHPEGKPLPVKLLGRFTTTQKAVEAVVAHHG
jgi:hypothetical protein